MSDAPKKPKVRVPKDPAKIAPAFLKGLPALDIQTELAKATPEQVQALTYENFALYASLIGVKVDNHPLEFDNHRYLLPIYLDTNKEIVWQKAAQLGATVYMLLKLLWFCRTYELKAGLYFPTDDGVKKLSKDRLSPMIKSNAEMFNNVNDDSDTLGLKRISNIHGTTSSLYIQHIGGQSSKDSVPLDVVAFDEVRLVDQKDIDQALERISHSSHKYKIFMSTAGLPGLDISRRYNNTNQMIWKIKCNCFPLSQTIVARKKGTGNPLPVSFAELKTDWENWEALSWSNRRKKWEYKAITAFHDNGKREVVEAKLRNGQRLVCTPDHKFFQAAGNYQRINELPLSEIPCDSSKDTLVNRKNFVLSACEIPDYDYHTKRQAHGPTSYTEFPADLDTLYVIGAYVAEGSWKTSKWMTISQIDGKPLKQRVVDWAVKNNLPYKIDSANVCIGLTSRPDLQDLFSQCGKGCQNKKFPDVLLGASKSQITAALSGYRAGDGHVFTATEDKRGYASNTQWSAITTSETLKQQLVFIGLRLGTPLHVTYAEPEDKRPTWTVTCNPNSVFARRLYDAGMSKVSIKSKNNLGFTTVADITVADNHNYVLADSGVLAHNCLDGFNAEDTFPNCIVDRIKKDGTRDVYLRCPRCKYRIVDPQNGNYVAQNPSNPISGYRVSQLISKFISTQEVWDFYKTTTHMQEFYNAKLALPFIDKENMPMTADVVEMAQRENLKWAMDRRREDRKKANTYAMGVDQHSGNVYISIGKRGPDGTKELVHYEIVESANPQYWVDGKPVSPFKRCYELMDEFDVQLCVVDAMPNINEAMDFARAFPKRVFVAHYKTTPGSSDTVQWADRPKFKQTVKKGSSEIKFKHTAFINRYLSLDYLFRLWTEGVWRMPNIDALTQTIRDEKTGKFESQNIIRTHFLPQMCSMVRQKKIMGEEEEGRYRMQWVNVGPDHTCHSMNYMNIALERMRQGGIFVV